MGTAVLGSILANRLPSEVQAASRLALAGTLHDLFLIAAAVATVALVATLFLREVPFTRQAARVAEEVREAA
jgi:hypothetical protein